MQFLFEHERKRMREQHHVAELHMEQSVLQHGIHAMLELRRSGEYVLFELLRLEPIKLDMHGAIGRKRRR